MNKKQKIAIAAVSVAMAGIMAVPFAACGPKRKPTNTGIKVDWDTKPELAENLTPKTDADGKLTYASKTALNLGMANSATQTIKFTTDELGGSFTFIDGKQYSSESLKPAWAGMAEQLDLTFNDVYKKASGTGVTQINQYITNGAFTNAPDLITGTLSDANVYSDLMLDINDYMYYMPNYRAFLEQNQVTLFSLTGNATTGAMYSLPYFDGNDDIEKYDMVRRDWVKIILDGDVSGATTTFKAQADAKGLNTTTDASAESYMGTTGSWTVSTTDLTDETKIVNLKVNYDAALTAAKDANSELGKALTAAGVTLSGLTSGNIVDLQNAAIKAKAGEVTGAQLANILRAYIDVAYTTESGAKFYTTRSDVFNSASAAWDVDLLVGLLRCVVTSQQLFDEKVQNLGMQYFYGIMARQKTTQRRVDLYALAGELYGIRGMESRLSGEYAYIDNAGRLQDARLDAEAYELLSKMSGLAKEGLLYTGADGTDGQNSYVASSSNAMAFMTHDYVQTQTRYAIDGVTNRADIPEGYDFAPIVTPVSKWDVDGNEDNGHETIMRFTESWRSVKNTGFVVPKANVTGNPDKLSAVLAFIDYLFSPDGQILMTYGPRSTSNTTPDGWWYCKDSSLALDTVATKIVDATNYSPAQYSVKDQYKQQVFVYAGKVYEGTKYADRNVPTVTDASMNWFLGKEVNGLTLGQTNLFNGIATTGNYTNYARQILGTTLPLGNKDQGFEYQCTAAAGLDGAAKVATAINNGTIKHVKLNLGALSDDEGYWYLCAPTALPLGANDRSAMTSSAQTLISGTYFLNSSSTDQTTNVFLDIMFYGLGDTDHYICGDEARGPLRPTGASFIALIEGSNKDLTARINIYQSSWYALDAKYGITGNN